MRIQSQFSLAALLAMGLFATGCSQQATDSAQSTQSSSPTSQQTTKAAQIQPEVIQREPIRTIVPSVTRPAPPPRPVHKPVHRPKVQPQQNKWSHRHPAIPGCTDSVTHVHPYTDRNHKHKYSCRGHQRPAVQQRRPVQRPVHRPVQRPVQHVRPQVVRPYMPKVKGNYKGPVPISPETRKLMQQYQK